MRAFDLARPQTVEQAVRLLGRDPAHALPLAGGSDLLALMKDRIETPTRLVSLRGIDALRVLSDHAGTLRIGALMTVDELAGDPVVRRLHPVLATAAAHVAAPQIRNVATVAGNLLQRPRCWYFRTGYGLLPQVDGRSMVVAGDNRFHAILGATPLVHFVHPSTLAPLLIALGARVTVAGAQGTREMDLEKLYRVPTREGEREHTLKPDELLTEVRVPPLAGRRVWSYEVRQKRSLDWSLATAAVALEMAGNQVRKARVVLGQVAPVPWTATAAERLLAGQHLDLPMADRAGRSAVDGAAPLSRNRYKVELARVAVKRALAAAVGLEEA
jgi:xanthine dehydrogenase YagS FAD-binding subunit